MSFLRGRSSTRRTLQNLLVFLPRGLPLQVSLNSECSAGQLPQVPCNTCVFSASRCFLRRTLDQVHQGNRPLLGRSRIEPPPFLHTSSPSGCGKSNSRAWKVQDNHLEL